MVVIGPSNPSSPPLPVSASAVRSQGLDLRCFHARFPGRFVVMGCDTNTTAGAAAEAAPAVVLPFVLIPMNRLIVSPPPIFISTKSSRDNNSTSATDLTPFVSEDGDHLRLVGDSIRTTHSIH